MKKGAVYKEFKGGVVYRVFINGSRLIDSSYDFYLRNGVDLSWVHRGPGVYMLECLDTGKRYIGSSNKLKSRLSFHLNSINEGRGGHSLYSHFKPRRVDFYVLESGDLSSDALKVLERYYIDKFDSIWPRGFNKKDPFTGEILV